MAANTAAKEAAKRHYLKHNGEVSVKVLARVAKVSQGTIRKWMKEEEWVEPGIKLSDKTKDVISTAAERFGLTEQEELFCYHYIRTQNQTAAGIKAGYSSSYAHNKAYRLLKEERIQSFLKYIRAQMLEELFIDPLMIVRQYAKVAFADMTDFVTFGPNGVSLKRSGDVDGQLISKVREGKDGVAIELVDKKWGMDKLEQYMSILPDWRKDAEHKRLDLMKEKLELEKAKLNGPSEEIGDDGFLEALGVSIKEVNWDEED